MGHVKMSWFCSGFLRFFFCFSSREIVAEGRRMGVGERRGAVRSPPPHAGGRRRARTGWNGPFPVPVPAAGGARP